MVIAPLSFIPTAKEAGEEVGRKEEENLRGIFDRKELGDESKRGRCRGDGAERRSGRGVAEGDGEDAGSDIYEDEGDAGVLNI